MKHIPRSKLKQPNIPTLSKQEIITALTGQNALTQLNNRIVIKAIIKLYAGLVAIGGIAMQFERPASSV